MQNQKSQAGLQLISPAFRDAGNIPVQYTCKGANVNPPLNFFNIPSGAKSLALIMHDPDAPGGDFLHWLLWDIPVNTETVAANSVPTGAIQGPNSFGKNSYGGPCPPVGTGEHHYIFELYALDKALTLAPETSREELEKELQRHILAQAQLSGLFGVNS